MCLDNWLRELRFMEGPTRQSTWRPSCYDGGHSFSLAYKGRVAPDLPAIPVQRPVHREIASPHQATAPSLRGSGQPFSHSHIGDLHSASGATIEKSLRLIAANKCGAAPAQDACGRAGPKHGRSCCRGPEPAFRQIPEARDRPEQVGKTACREVYLSTRSGRLSRSGRAGLRAS